MLLQFKYTIWKCTIYFFANEMPVFIFEKRATSE